MLTNEQTIKLNHIIADRLLNRLEFMPFKPDNILDLGLIDEYLINKLSIYYPNAELYGLYKNINNNQVKFSNKHNIFAANLPKLPLADSSFDLIISNLFIDCLDNQINKYFKELYRIIRPDGLLLFTMLNSTNINKNQFINIGDLLLGNQFCDPVVDQELINLNYRSGSKKQLNNVIVEIFYGHGLGNNLINIPIHID